MRLSILLFVATLARGHGGEDHGPPPAPTAASTSSAAAARAGSATGVRVSTWSSEFEAVLSLPGAAPGVPVDATLLLADFNTSAPIGTGTAALALEGPAPLAVTIPAGEQPGVWPFHLTFPSGGSYGGGLTVITADRADVLGLPAFDVTEAAHAGAGSGWGRVAGGLVCGVLAGLLLGMGAARRLWRVAPAAATLLVLVVAERVSAHGGEDHGPPAAPSAAGGGLNLPLESQFLLEVRTTRAAVRPFAERVTALGTTVAPPGGSAEIHAPVTGVLSVPEVGSLGPGAQVTAGQTLATIAESLGGADRSSVVDARTSAQVRLAQARSALALAERDQQQAAALGGVLSGKERLAREQAVEVARAELEQAQIGARSLSGASSSTLVLKAPISGRIATMLARPGDVVAPGDVLYRIVGDGGLWISVRAPVALAGQLAVGAAATVETDARPGQVFAATVLDPGLEADPGTGTVEVTLSLDDPSAGLIPGMAVTASIVSGGEREALTVPDGAVVDSSGESLVFVKTGPESFEARPVRTGARSAELREITAGLLPDERVVVQGTYTLRSLAGR